MWHSVIEGLCEVSFLCNSGEPKWLLIGIISAIIFLFPAQLWLVLLVVKKRRLSPNEVGPLITKKIKNWPMIVFGMIWFSFFLLMGTAFMKSEKMQSETVQWITVEVHVIESSVSQSTHSAAAGGYTTTYRPKIRYTYEVGNKSFDSETYGYHSTLGPGGYNANSRPSVQKIVDQYPTGSPATAYYNPDDHSESVLDNGPPKTNWMINLTFMLAAFLGIAMIVFGVRGKMVKVRS